MTSTRSQCTRCHKVVNSRSIMFYIAGFGNPLLDYVFRIPNRDVLDKHGLKPDDIAEISWGEIDELLADLKNYQGVYSVGGSTQNTLRIMEWILGGTKQTVMFGSVGDDNNGALLKNKLEGANVTTVYETIANTPTGFIVGIVYNEFRTLVGNIGAAECFKMDYSANSLFKKATVVYMEGFFLTNRLKIATNILAESKKNNKLFIFNLSACYLIENQLLDVKIFVDGCDILFGNWNEFQSLSKLLQEKDVKGTVLRLLTTNVNKVVVVTKGGGEVIVGYNGTTIQVIQVPVIDGIVDTTGAGDSFVAGFLCRYLVYGDVVRSVQWGCIAAGEIIKQIGCNAPQLDPSSVFV